LNCGRKLEEIKQEISNNPAIIKKPRVLCPFCHTELDRSNNYCFKCNRHTKKEESSNSIVFVIFSLTGGLLAFSMIYFPAFMNPTSIFLISLGLVIFACYKKTGIIPCFAVVWVLFCIWVFIRYS